MKNILYTIILSFLFSSSVFADFQAGMDAYLADDNATAYKEWKPLAEQGHAEAQYRIGRMYENGDGVTQDYNEVMKWFRLAAAQGHAQAQYRIGRMYSRGDTGYIHEPFGVTQDFKEAVKWYRLGAEQGHVGAQYSLGLIYDAGKVGLPQNSEAVKWYRLAAEQGHEEAQHNLVLMYALKGDYATAYKELKPFAEQGNEEAQYNLGLMYARGEGVIEDDVIAHMWFNIAANCVCKGVTNVVENAKKGRDALAQKMTPEQITKAQKLADECIKKDYKDCG